MKTCHSEYGSLSSVFIKRSSDAFVDDKTIDRDWARLNYISRPDLIHAEKEYGMFESILNRSVQKIHHFGNDPSTTMDSIYCRDASIATDKGMILCNMGKAARVSEPAAQRKAFERAGIAVLGAIQAPGTVEGGDVAWIDPKTLAVGHTYRTNEAGIEQLKSLLKPMGVSVITVPLPHYKGPSDVFHLMSILSPVDKDLAVVYSPLMPIPFRNELLARGYEFVEVPNDEFESMGCNVLAVGPRKVVMAKGNPRTSDALAKARCQVTEYDGTEISVKGGGGPTCLTRPLDREV
jgi:N-dimethylarginine dimethylaminohydrolase